MSNKNKNAFGYISNYVESKGLTKREYFAGLAMQGILSNHSLIDADDWEWVAKNAIKQADDLLTQLENDTNI
jgi:hypothetical protein